MKKIVILFCSILLAMVLINPSPAKEYSNTYDKLLTKENMYMFEKHMMQTMVDDFMWLALTKPKDVDELSKQILNLKYKVDGPNEGLKSPSETYNNGGDCEDMTLFVISRLWQSHTAKIGFILFCPEKIETNQAHICAISQRPDKQIIVIDATCKRIRTLSQQLKVYKKSKYDYYKIHWFFEDNSQNRIMKIIK
jgi:hypothetical protein